MQVNITKFQINEKTHWRYYLELEAELLSTRKYVDFDPANFKTFSVEYLKLYQAVCSEIDVFGKVLAAEINPAFVPGDSKNTILKWWYEVQAWYQQLPNKKVSFCRSFDLEPWANFEVETYQDRNGVTRYRIKDPRINHNPAWWKEYTDVKHQRSLSDNAGNLNYRKANFGNLCQAIAALYILEKNYFAQIGDEEGKAYMGKSEIFEPRHSTYVDGTTIMIGF